MYYVYTPCVVQVCTQPTVGLHGRITDHISGFLNKCFEKLTRLIKFQISINTRWCRFKMYYFWVLKHKNVVLPCHSFWGGSGGRERSERGGTIHTIFIML